MVTLMGGDITVESTKGEGSVFEVSFVNPILAYTGVQETSDPASFYRRPCILAVEDSPEIQMLLEYMLGDIYDVETSPNEDGALTMARQKPYDLVLMDINLGGGRTGEDVMTSLREVPGYADTPIVAMTAYALLEDRERFLEAGFDGYLSKPFTMRQAQQMVQHMLNLKGRVPDQKFPFQGTG